MIRDLIVGVVGAFPGGWLFAVAFVVVGGGFFVSLLTGFVGAVILLCVVRLVAPCLQPSHRLSGTVIDGPAVTHLTFLRPVYPVKSRTDEGTDRTAVETDRELTARMARAELSISLALVGSNSLGEV